jgi:hypothetical protein
MKISFDFKECEKLAKNFLIDYSRLGITIFLNNFVKPVMKLIPKSNFKHSELLNIHTITSVIKYRKPSPSTQLVSHFFL